MQQTELYEILPELKGKAENFERYGVVNPTLWDIDNRNYNIVRERKERREFEMLALVRSQKDILSSVR